MNKTSNITPWFLIKASIPTISMLIFMSLYSIVDGVFVSQYVGTDALSAINIVYPFINILIAVGVMLATGGSALIAKKMGEKDLDNARKDFSLIVVVGLVLGALFTIIGILFLDDIIRMLGADKVLFDYCKDYLSVIIWFSPMFILSLIYQIFTVTAGNSNVGLVLTLVGGFTNMILDYIFIVPMNLGIVGASLATGIGNMMPAILGTAYFLLRKSDLYLVIPKFKISTIKDSCINGSSEMVGNLATGVTTMLFNIAMMKYVGSDGVSALTIVLYGQFLITAVFMGFATGIAPLLSFNYGAKNVSNIKKIVSSGKKCVLVSSILLYTVSLVICEPIVGVFATPGTNVFELGCRGFIIFATSFLFTGVNICVSGMFTAFSNGKISAIISFYRTFVFIIIGIILLPMAFGVDGIWMSVPIAEFLSMIVCLYYFKKHQKTYSYSKDIDDANTNICA